MPKDFQGGVREYSPLLYVNILFLSYSPSSHYRRKKPQMSKSWGSRAQKSEEWGISRDFDFHRLSERGTEGASKATRRREEEGKSFNLM